jgi:TolB protein
MGMGDTTGTGGLGLFSGQADIGRLSAPGLCAYDAERQTYTIAASGANIWGDRDDFSLVWRRMSGDFILTCDAAFVGAGANAHRKLGWMVRAGLEADSPHVSAVVHGDGLTSLQFRRAAGGHTEERRSPLSSADVVQLERVGGSYRMSVARHGGLFVAEDLEGLDIGEAVYVGLFVCARDQSAVETALFHNVRVVVPVAQPFDRQRDPLASKLEIVELASGHRRVVYESPGIFEAPNWTPDGAALIYNSQGRLYRFDLATGTSEVIDTGEVTRNNNDHVLSFDGTTLGISSARGGEEYISRVYTVPVGGGAPKLITEQGPSYLHGWSPDGRYLVYTGLRDGDYDIYRIGADGGEETRLTTAKGLDDGPEYTPDGAFIYFNSVRSGTMQIWRMRPDGSDQEQVTDDEFNNWFPHISPDGRWVVFLTYAEPVVPSDHPAAKRVYLRLMPAGGGEPQVLAYLYGGQGTINVPSWSPDSASIAFVSNTAAL